MNPYPGQQPVIQSQQPVIQNQQPVIQSQQPVIQNQQPVIQSQQDPDTEARSYRVKTLRIFGGIQIGVGALCAILSLVGVVFDSTRMYEHCSYTSYDYHYNRYPKRNRYNDAGILFGFDITCLIFAGWNFLTGSFPFFMNQKRRNSWRCLKMAFMICSIIGAAVFMSTVFSLGVAGAVIRARDSGGLAALSSFLAVLGIIEIAVSILGASYCCCCSLCGDRQRTKYVYVTANQPGMWLNIPQTQIPNQQIQMPASIPMTTTQPNNQAIAATAQQYQVPTVSAQQYQMPSGAAATAVAHQPVTVDTQPPPNKE